MEIFIIPFFDEFWSVPLYAPVALLAETFRWGGQPSRRSTRGGIGLIKEVNHFQSAQLSTGEAQWALHPYKFVMSRILIH